MNYSKTKKLVLALTLICSFIVCSCRKKDERYEGNYIGTERLMERDSAEATYSLDSTYHQEYEVTYDDKIYTFLKLFNNPDNQIFEAGKESITDGEYQGYGEIYYDTDGNEIGTAGSMKFSGDSIYIQSSSSFNGDEKTVEFRGKRN